MKKEFLLLSVVFLGACASGSMREQLEANALTIQRLQDQVIDLRAEKEGLERQLAEAQQGRVPTGVLAVASTSRLEEGRVLRNDTYSADYEHALALYRAGDIEGAVLEFERFLSQGMRDEYSVFAQYWIGDAAYTLRDYEKAARYLGTFLRNMPESDKTQNALNKLILSLRALGRNGEAEILARDGVDAIR